MAYLADDDIHFCLRCRRTILGLGAYVEHRSQKNCHLQSGETSSPAPSTSTDSIKQLISISANAGRLVTTEQGTPGAPTSDVDPGLEADDFFSLLELQSSTKTGSSGIADLSVKDQKKPVGTGVFTRGKRRRGEGKVKERGVNLRKLVGGKKWRRFGKGGKRNKVKKVVSDEGVVASGVSKDLVASDFVEVTFETLLKTTETRQNPAEERRIENNMESSQENLVTNEEEIEKTGDKPFPELFSDFPQTPTSFPYFQNNISSSTEEVLPSTCGDELEEAAGDEEEDEEEEEVVPPRSYGGKWKPGSSPSLHHQRSLSLASVTWSDQEVANALSWGLESSTSTDPVNKSTIIQKQGSMPPPGHTRGKWLPSSNNDLLPKTGTAQWTGNRVQYWCGVCNRRLSSRGLYERHLMSPLHTRRTRHERQLDEDYLQHRAAPGGGVTSRRPRRLSRKLQETLAARMAVRGVKKTVKRDGKKPRNKTIQCEVCDLQVARHQIGKHLVSRFHLRRAATEPEAARRMTQSHAIPVARQAPFRCAICCFYCNTLDSMMFHWTSKMHRDRDAEVPGRYWCAVCKHFSDTSAGMEVHLRSDQHKEVVSVINKSFPIEIQKLVPLKCDVAGCERIFRYNSQLRLHSRLTGHVQTSGSASDSYQARIKCSQCSFVANSKRRLLIHMVFRHRLKKFFCSYCEMRFDTREEAVQHRRGEMHKYTVLRKCKAPNQLARACAHCSEVLSDILALKQHLAQMHPDKAHRCAKCGESFTMWQELSHHVRSSCQGLPEKLATSDDVTTPSTSKAEVGSDSSCPKCNYTSSSKTELLYHVALHGDPVYSKNYGKEGSKYEVPKFVCPTCSRLVRKDSLRNHLTTHTGEKCHVCNLCGLAFSRADVLIRHRKLVHKETMQCSICDVIFANAFSLRRHVQNHDQAREKSQRCSECGLAFIH
ncbi:hypothetical protein LSTR_LSTR001370 [Laodelphax striatellus]|uniref:C2H2-type domain-containing protein n=1 Tax=Laodelphax striatellus TaxID=195883 RepID=A0A482X9D4_LAOST|nr:hypothetical protein LSTR_LSTR001370 [Laodelphax striatellus]